MSNGYNPSPDSSPHRSLSADESESDTEDENLKPRGMIKLVLTCPTFIINYLRANPIAASRLTSPSSPHCSLSADESESDTEEGNLKPRGMIKLVLTCPTFIIHYMIAHPIAASRLTSQSSPHCSLSTDESEFTPLQPLGWRVRVHPIATSWLTSPSSPHCSLSADKSEFTPSQPLGWRVRVHPIAASRLTSPSQIQRMKIWSSEVW